jgi:hypothetical protein
MWLQGNAIRRPELAAGEGQNQPQLRIMLGNWHQVNEKKGPRIFVAPASRPRHPQTGRPSSVTQKEKGPENSDPSSKYEFTLLIQKMPTRPLRHNLAGVFRQRFSLR